MPRGRAGSCPESSSIPRRIEKTFFNKLRSIFEQACILGPEEREGYLEEACRGDASLREELDALLSCDAEHDSIPRGVVSHVQGLVEEDRIPRPERIGSYEIHGTLGYGGMGLVYRARQKNPDREVALKVLRPGAVTERKLKRFELETQALGRLRHPGIAQIYEAGSADIGFGPQPYFAMELVEGTSFVEHVEQLGIKAKLALLVEICRAVHHAHQRGVIHRDLKPENLMINTEGRVKILDFGVARLTDVDVRMTTQSSDVAQIIGTLPYMSPEQAGGAIDEIDSRTDIYSLGVIAYEMLGGRLPIDLADQTVPQAVRMIIEKPHVPLSSIQRVLRGDVETIVGKALEKDPARRYASAAELAADIERHLANEPIVARPPSAIYQLRKFARRHRGLAIGAVMSVTILLVAVIALSILMVQAQSAEARAMEKTRVTLAVNEFLERFLSAPNPHAMDGEGREVKVIEFLDAAAAEVGTAFPDLPAVEGAVRRMLGSSYAGLALYEEAQRELEAAVEILRAVDPEDAETIAAVTALAGLYTDIDRGDEAIELLEMIIAHHRKDAEANAEQVYETTVALITALWERNRREEAKALVFESLEPCRSALGEANPIFLQLLSDRATMLRGEEGLAAAQEAFALHRDHLGPDAPGTLNIQHTLAMRLFRHGQREDGERMMREECEAKGRVFGETAPETLWSMSDLSDLCKFRGRLEEALSLRLEILRRIEAAGLDDNRLNFHSLRKAALLLILLDRLDEAAAHAQRSADGYAEIHPHDHMDLLSARYTLADINYRRGRFAEAHELLEFLAEDCSTIFPTHMYRTFLTTAGRCAEKVGKLAVAETHFLRLLELNEALAEDAPQREVARQDLIRVQTAQEQDG